MKYQDIIPYIEKGLITERIHPLNSDVRLFDYAEECQFAKAWDDVTMQCRGLVMNIVTGEKLTNPFPKFFNYSEYSGEIPSETPIVTDKVDGSLGILYWLNDEPYICTRGSFESEQAKWATEYINRPDVREKVDKLDRAYTYLFEIVYPANRIVLIYDFSGLVFLAARALDNSNEFLSLDGWQSAAVSEFTDVESLKALNIDNKEGFVLYYPTSRLRLKIKFDEYIRLHKIMTGLSEIGVWEMMKEKGVDLSPHDVLKDVPDEFFNWVEGVMTVLAAKYRQIELECTLVAKEAARYPLSERKYAAEYILKNAKYPGVCFSMLDNKQYSDAIFKIIRPVGKTLYN